MPKVLVLPEHIASQIAAGEVVERPSSVVKELVENSLDAGASEIEISISADCRDIRIADNGGGMEPEDAVLAFQRHATSKLRSADDLWSLNTLGFRGEALPSIASISKFTCITRTHEAEHGTKVESADGQLSATETGCAPGTIMEVRDLFFNTPARLSFMKKAATEFGHIEEVVRSLAISYPEVAFTLIEDGTQVLRTTGSGDLAKSVVQSKFLTGKEALLTVEFEGAVKGNEKGKVLKIEGIMAKPLHFRGDRKGILTIVNRRAVRCPLTNRALDYVYSDLIPRGRYPLAVVKIQLDPNLVDVNIHPTKREVKYQSGNDIYITIQRALAATLRQGALKEAEAFHAARPHYDTIESPVQISVDLLSTSDTIKALRITPQDSLSPEHQSADMPASFRNQTLQQSANQSSTQARARGGDYDAYERKDRTFNFESPAETRRSREETPQVEQISFRDDLQSENIQYRHAEQETSAYSGAYTNARSPIQDNRVEESRGEQGICASDNLPEAGETIHLGTESDYSLPADWRIVGYLRNTYILVDTAQGLEIIEQHIAHERTLYERLLAAQTTPGRITELSQKLLVSRPLNLSPEQIETLAHGREALSKLGFEFDFDADGNVSVSQLPLELSHINYVPVIQKLLEDLATVDATNLELEATKSIACQSAIKNGMPLGQRDIIKLLSDWLKTERNDTCPHGRPVRLKFSMEKLFEMFHPA